MFSGDKLENGVKIIIEAMLATFTRFYLKKSLTPETLHPGLTLFPCIGWLVQGVKTPDQPG